MVGVYHAAQPKFVNLTAPPRVQRSLKQTLDAAPVGCIHQRGMPRPNCRLTRLPWHKRNKTKV